MQSSTPPSLLRRWAVLLQQFPNSRKSSRGVGDSLRGGGIFSPFFAFIFFYKAPLPLPALPFLVMNRSHTFEEQQIRRQQNVDFAALIIICHLFLVAVAQWNPYNRCFDAALDNRIVRSTRKVVRKVRRFHMILSSYFDARLPSFLFHCRSQEVWEAPLFLQALQWMDEWRNQNNGSGAPNGIYVIKRLRLASMRHHPRNLKPKFKKKNVTFSRTFTLDGVTGRKSHHLLLSYPPSRQSCLHL